MGHIIKMRILLISGIYPPDVGGPATYLPQLEIEILRNGDVYKIITLSDNVKFISKSEKVIKISRKLAFPIRFFLTILVISYQANQVDFIFTNGLFEETGVAVVPGDAFGLGGFMRISYATADDVLVDALARIKKAADSIDGVDAAIASIAAEKAAQ